MRTFISIAFLIPSMFALGCASQMIPEKNLKILNSEIRDHIYTVKKEIRSDFAETEFEKSELLYKGGEEVRLYVESGGTWIRIKAFSKEESSEQARGRTVVYLFRKDYPDVNNSEEFGKIIALKIDELFKRK